MACRLYGSGAVKTKREASIMAGLHPNTLTVTTGRSEQANRLISDLSARIEDETVQTSVILQHLGRKALSKIAALMEHADSEHLQFKAAQDLADRAPETQKVQRVAMESLTLSGKDVQALADAMVESAREREQYASARDGLVEISDTLPPINSTLHQKT
jgi:hypothetical protein